MLKGPMQLMVRTIGIVRAEAGITLATMAYNMKRWVWLDRRAGKPARSRPKGKHDCINNTPSPN